MSGHSMDPVLRSPGPSDPAALVASSNNLRLTAICFDDRQQHRLTAVHNNSEIELLSSIEGTSEQIWPVSPVVQEYLRHTEEDRFDCLLGVGNSGTTHYSASLRIELDEALFTAEFAARIKSPAERLSTTYLVPGTLKVSLVSEGGVLIKYESLIWELAANFGTEIHWDATTRRVTLARADSNDVPPATLQWGFTLQTKEQADK